MTNVKPDVVYVHLGGNDLTKSHSTAHDIGEEMEDLVDDLLDMNIPQVVVSQMLFRYNRDSMQVSPRLYNMRVTDFNRYNRVSYSPNVPQNNSVRYWFHHGLWNKKYSTIGPDGVHLNSRGSKNFLRSIRGACMQAVSRVRPQLRVGAPPVAPAPAVARVRPSVRPHPPRPLLLDF